MPCGILARILDQKKDISEEISKTEVRFIEYLIAQYQCFLISRVVPWKMQALGQLREEYTELSVLLLQLYCKSYIT